MNKPTPVLPDDPGYKLSLAGQLSARHVLQLFEVRVGKRPLLFGNALLVRHLGRVFLVSAGHVLNPLSHAERPLFYFSETGNGLARLRLRGIAFTQGTAESDGKDLLDLAAGELISELPFPGLKEPLESSQIVALGPPSSEDVYLATGFPASRSKADPSSNRLTTILSAFQTTLAPAAARAALRTHPELQLVLSLNIDRMNFPDGSVKAIADPAGMSGSPIWLQQGDELKCAGNNRDKNFTSHKVQVRMQQLEHSINRYLTELDRADRDPTIVLPDRVARLKEKISKIKEQMRGLGEIEAHLQSSQERQVSFTDPDARSMATSRLGSAVVGYNVQTAVDAKHHLIVAHEVTNAVTDRGQLAAMAMAAKEATAHPSLIVLADRGYFEGYQILECEQAGIATMVPKALTSGGKFEGRFDKRDFIYDKERDEYRCPAGQKAIRRFTTVEDGKTLNKYWSSSCPGCHLKEQCTPAPYRRISRWEHEDVLEVVQARLDGAPAASRLRQSIHVLAYAFQAPDIMQALVDAKNRGVEVRVVVDKKRNRGKTSRKAMDFVTRHGVELRTNDHFHIHHDKTIIVDGHTVQTGSFNFAPSAETLNSENVVVIRGLPEVSSQYMAHWQSRWKLGKPYPAQP